MDALIRYLRSHKWARRSLSGLSIILLFTAVGLLSYPLYTNMYQGRVQNRLDEHIASPELQQRYRSRSLKVGDALTRIKIPKLGVDVTVVEGISASALRAGAGHYPDTPLPCEVGNVAIAGHRTTYGKPFANLEILKPGDKVILETPFARHTYEVIPSFAGHRNPWVVAANDWSVAEQSPESILTLTTCHPRGSDTERLVARARLVESKAFT